MSENFLILIAALMSRSCIVLQVGYCHSLSFNIKAEFRYPQTLQSLEDGSNLPILRIVFPSHSALYSNLVTKLLHATSPIACARQWFSCSLPGSHEGLSYRISQKGKKISEFQTQNKIFILI